MKPAPSGWPRLSIGVTYQDANKAIDWLCKAFGFELRVKIPNEKGGVAHSEMTFGEAVIMTGDGHRAWQKSPRDLGGMNTQAAMIYVDDVDAHCARARAAGAQIAVEPNDTDYGPDWYVDRGYEAVDLEGGHWWFYQRLRDKVGQ